MILAQFFTLKNGDTAGFHIKGHAGYGPEGEDIICAAVSAVTYTALGYMDELLVKRQNEHLYFTEKDGEIVWMRYEGDSPVGDLEKEKVDAVLEAMQVGLKQIQESYGKKYLKITSQEVR